jgi:toxoflavin synthase
MTYPQQQSINPHLERTQQLRYDEVGILYNDIKSAPASVIERATFLSGLGSVSGCRALDLACGAGYYSGVLLEKGARSVVGYDISPGMINAARTSFRDHPNVEFRVSDCVAPLRPPEGEHSFDVIVAVWFLNYATDEAQLLAMCQNVARNLKSGGKFIGVTPNPQLDFREPLDPRYGLPVRAIEGVKDGWKCKLTAFTKPRWEIETYVLDEAVYLRCFEKAGLRDIQVVPLVVPEEGREKGFWDVYLQRPHIQVITGTV